MIIIFSVLNGLVTLAKEPYKAFYPDIRISTVRGKFFAVDATKVETIRHLDGVQKLTISIEDNVFAVNNDQQKIITLKGIENNYFSVNDIKQYLTTGSDDTVSTGNPYTAIVGKHIINELGTDINTLSRIELNYPNPDASFSNLDPGNAIERLGLHPAGVFSVSDEFDNKYVLAPLSLVQNLFHQPGKCSSIELKVQPESTMAVQKQLQQLLGTAFKVETRYEQNKTMYMVMGAEKWAVFAILVLVLVIATFNMVGALSMLVLQKQKDIAILRAMGAQQSTIRSVFLFEGILWSLTGGVSGIVLGAVICLLQQKFGFIRLGGSSFLVDAYPVELQFTDVIYVLVTVMLVGLAISWYPAMRATRAIDPSLKSA